MFTSHVLSRQELARRCGEAASASLVLNRASETTPVDLHTTLQTLPAPLVPPRPPSVSIILHPSPLHRWWSANHHHLKGELQHLLHPCKTSAKLITLSPARHQPTTTPPTYTETFRPRWKPLPSLRFGPQENNRFVPSKAVEAAEDAFCRSCCHASGPTAITCRRSNNATRETAKPRRSRHPVPKQTDEGAMEHRGGSGRKGVSF